jgi:tyrosine-protein kinase Etk/Wzc
MTIASEHHALTPIASRSPIPSISFESHVTQPQDDSSSELKGYIYTLYDSRWLIGAIAAIVTAIAVIYALVANPVYEANLIIHVEEESSNATKNILSEASSMFENKKTAIAEIELLRSRMVVSQALDNLQLYLDVQPKYFPILGAWLANRNGNGLSNPGLFGYGDYVWGAEKAEISLFEVPDAWLGREFTITALDNERFRFAGGDQPIVFEGKIGLRYQVRAPQGVVALKINRMNANPGAGFRLKRLSRLAMTEAVQNSLAITEQGKQSGIIEVKLQGQNPQRTYTVLDEIGREYIRQNLSRKTEEAEKSLSFLNRQLPVLKRQLEQAEDRYNKFRNANGTVDLREEARLSLAQVTAAHTRQIDLTQKKAELLARFTEDHPIVAAINRQRKEVDVEIASINARIKAMPMLEQEEARLTRDIKVNSDLYASLSNTAQQLRLTSVSRVSNVRLVDTPIRPEKPIKPKRALIVTLAAVTGVFLGTLVAFARKVLRGGIDDPAKIDQMLRARVVYATIPHSATQDKLMRRSKNDKETVPLLAKLMPEDPAIESLRSFRAALQYSMPHFKNNIVMFAGPTRGIGKSFVSANFAAVMATSGKRVLLIDADLRNGQLNRYFGQDRKPGLSHVILGDAELCDVIQHGVTENLDFIASGEPLSNSSEFLLNSHLGKFLKQTSTHYDLVLLDSPPLLAAADALIIGAHIGALFIVARSGSTNENEINESINRLHHAGISVQGILLNDMMPRLSGYSPYRRSGTTTQIGAGTLS